MKSPEDGSSALNTCLMSASVRSVLVKDSHFRLFADL